MEEGEDLNPDVGKEGVLELEIEELGNEMKYGMDTFFKLLLMRMFSRDLSDSY